MGSVSHCPGGDGETVTPSLPKPDVWTGTASVDVLGPLRWKRAKPIETRGEDIVQPVCTGNLNPGVVVMEPAEDGA